MPVSSMHAMAEHGPGAHGSEGASGPLVRTTRAGGPGQYQPAWNFTTSGTMSNATMLMILISGFTAGPAVSL